MSTLLIVVALLCVIAGVAGCILPVLPGPPLSFLALLLMKWSGAACYGGRFLLLWGLVTLVVTVLDYTLPGWLSRRFGGSRYAATGSTVGLLFGLFFFPPWGFLFGAFAGALLGELLHDSRDRGRALRVAMSSFAAFILGTGLKLGVSLTMGYYVVRALFA